jgi:hypothetical protein
MEKNLSKKPVVLLGGGPPPPPPLLPPSPLYNTQIDHDDLANDLKAEPKDDGKEKVL